jgi:hypothetical protein
MVFVFVGFLSGGIALALYYPAVGTVYARQDYRFDTRIIARGTLLVKAIIAPVSFFE